MEQPIKDTVVEAVREDLLSRSERGILKYNTTLKFNDKDNYLNHLYEEILGVEMDKSNFRRKILHMKLLVALDEKQQDVSHRAAKLYKFDPEIYEKLTQKGFNFEF